MTSTQLNHNLDSEIGALRPRLLKLARYFADDADAEDLVQEALARALERRDSLRPGTDLRAWMRPVMRNLAIDEGRRRRRLRQLDERHAQAPGEPEQAPPAWMDLNPTHVRRALGCCSDKLRTAFELHYWDSLSLDAIATRVGVPRATVGTRLYRARVQVRRALERDLAQTPG